MGEYVASYFAFKHVEMYRPYVQAVTIATLQSIISATLPVQRERDPSPFNVHFTNKGWCVNLQQIPSISNGPHE